MTDAWAEDENGMMIPLTATMTEPGVIVLDVWDPEESDNDG